MYKYALMRFPRRKSRGSIKHIRVLQYELPGGLLGNIYILLLLLYYCEWIASVIRLLSTTSITLIIGNFTFCLFSADSGQREVYWNYSYYYLTHPFRLRVRRRHYIKTVSGHFSLVNSVVSPGWSLNLIIINLLSYSAFAAPSIGPQRALEYWVL